MRLSVVTTMYRSAPYLREFHARAAVVAARVSADVEFVYVNDGSPDDALAVALDLRREHGNVRVVDLSRNFGHHKAMMAGLAHTTGDLVFLIDCDLEELPEVLEDFAARKEDTGADVVYGVQQARRGGPADRLLGWAFYRAYNALTTDPIPPNLMTVRLMTRRYVNALLSHRETELTIAGLWARTGFTQVPIPVDKGRKPVSSYSLHRKLGVLLNAITAFSSKPLYYIFGLGVVMLGLSLLTAGGLVVRHVLFGDMLNGWPSLMVSLWMLSGLIIFCQGVIGIYLAKVYLEVKRRPATITREVFDPLVTPAPAVVPLRRTADL